MTKFEHSGLTNMTDDQVTDFYMRWREWMKAITLRGIRAVSHPKYKAFFVDMLDELREDPWWTLQVVGSQQVYMLFSDDVPEGEILFFDLSRPAGQKLMTIQQAVKSSKGFGSFGFIAPPSPNGVVPFPENRE